MTFFSSLYPFSPFVVYPIDAYCLLLLQLGSVEDIDDAWITVQRCKRRYDRQSLHSVRDTLILTFFSVYACCVYAIISHKPLIALIMKDRERRNRFIAVNTHTHTYSYRRLMISI